LWKRGVFLIDPPSRAGAIVDFSRLIGAPKGRRSPIGGS